MATNNEREGSYGYFTGTRAEAHVKAERNYDLFAPGTEVETVDDFNGYTTHVNFGKVVRLTQTLIIMKNEHGNEQRFRLKDLKQVGYAWPQLTNSIRVKR